MSHPITSVFWDQLEEKRAVWCEQYERKTKDIMEDENEIEYIMADCLDRDNWFVRIDLPKELTVNYYRELDDAQIDILEGYYFEHFAAHNEDESGCQNWVEGLEYDEAIALINKINKKNE